MIKFKKEIIILKMPGELKKGEKLFLDKHQKIQKSKEIKTKETKSKENISHFEIAKEISQTIESIKKEIENLPEMQKEMSYHPTMPANQTTNILAQAIKIALDEGIDQGIKFIYETKNPYLIDAFHDILIGHFLDLILKQKK